jgi:hypothetical protein
MQKNTVNYGEKKLFRKKRKCLVPTCVHVKPHRFAASVRRIGSPHGRMVAWSRGRVFAWLRGRTMTPLVGGGGVVFCSPERGVGGREKRGVVQTQLNPIKNKCLIQCILTDPK